jgi:hypothetical protein
MPEAFNHMVIATFQAARIPDWIQGRRSQTRFTPG